MHPPRVVNACAFVFGTSAQLLLYPCRHAWGHPSIIVLFLYATTTTTCLKTALMTHNGIVRQKWCTANNVCVKKK